MIVIIILNQLEIEFVNQNAEELEYEAETFDAYTIGNLLFIWQLLV